MHVYPGPAACTLSKQGQLHEHVYIGPAACSCMKLYMQSGGASLCLCVNIAL